MYFKLNLKIMKYLKMMSFLLLTVVMFSCSSDSDTPKPPTAEFFFEVEGTEVTFTSEMSNVESFEWNFGDGTTSTEKDPVHAYETPQTYKVSLNIKGTDGSQSAVSKDVEVLETPEYLLTGGAAHPNGKTWKMKYEVAPNHDKEGVGLVENNLTIQQFIDEDGFLEWISLPQGYNDTFTFTYDGKYTVNNSDSYGGSLMTLIYAAMNYNMEAYPTGDVLGVSSQLALAPMADILYTPKADATWSFSDTDFDVDAAIIDPASGEILDSYTLTFTGKERLVLDEYFGFKDASIVVIIKELSETEMNVAIGMHASQTDPARVTHMVHLTFEAVPFPAP
jgi:PKD repeat protein